MYNKILYLEKPKYRIIWTEGTCH